jgi:hypothetical protein
VFDRISEKFSEVRQSANNASESVNRFLDSIVGPGAEARGNAFARLIDLSYTKPIETFLDRLARFFDLIDRIAAGAARVGEFFGGRGQLSLPGGSFDPTGNLSLIPAPAPTT